MKVVFCTDDKYRYLILLKVAVRSLRAIMGNDIECLCVYAGNKEETLQELAADQIPVARYTPRLQFAGKGSHIEKSKGCFLKLELCLLPELINDDFVLYCDTDVMFIRSIAELLQEKPSLMAMAREYTAPFYHDYQNLDYVYNDLNYNVPLPFPIWTFSSGVVVFNLRELRKHHRIDHFLAFSQQNMIKIGNLDQSLLNYYFGKRITLLDAKWNRPPYHKDCHDTAHIVHFHGLKPWESVHPSVTILEGFDGNDFPAMREKWFEWLSQDEKDNLKTRLATIN